MKDYKKLDTDKYKGHTRYDTRMFSPWCVGYEGQHNLPEGDIPINGKLGGLIALAYSDADAKLIADAPLLLAEVEELQAWKKLVSDIVQQQDGSHLREMLKELIE